MFEAVMYNTSPEPITGNIAGRNFYFPELKVTKVPYVNMSARIENFPEYLEREWGVKGLVWVKPGEDIKEAERRGLLNFLNVLDFRLKNYQKLREQYEERKEAFPEKKEERLWKKWMDTISKELELVAPIENLEDPFAKRDLDAVQVQLGAVRGPQETEVRQFTPAMQKAKTEQVESKRGPGRRKSLSISALEMANDDISEYEGAGA
jgi:hypothetical protein